MFTRVSLLPGQIDIEDKGELAPFSHFHLPIDLTSGAFLALIERPRKNLDEDDELLDSS